MKIKKKLAVREINGEMFIVDIEKETLHNINETGAFLWKCFARGIDAAIAAKSLANEFDVTEEEALADTKEFLKTLEMKGLISR